MYQPTYLKIMKLFCRKLFVDNSNRNSMILRLTTASTTASTTTAASTTTSTSAATTTATTSSKNNNSIQIPIPSALPILWILDGIGLAILTACTLLDAFDIWNDFFIEYVSYNASSMSFWLSGRLCQVMGLLFLIGYAASFQLFHEFEIAGMILLTIGPFLNIAACSLFTSEDDSVFMFNRRWLFAEIMEVLGIVVLDISMIPGWKDVTVLFAEVLGYFVLGIGAVVEVETFLGGTLFPAQWELRVDPIHVSDCVGLSILVVVTIAQFCIKSSVVTIPSATSSNSTNVSSPYSKAMERQILSSPS